MVHGLSLWWWIYLLGVKPTEYPCPFFAGSHVLVTNWVFCLSCDGDIYYNHGDFTRLSVLMGITSIFRRERIPLLLPLRSECLLTLVVPLLAAGNITRILLLNLSLICRIIKENWFKRSLPARSVRKFGRTDVRWRHNQIFSHASIGF